MGLFWSSISLSMSITITIKDETAGGQIINQLPVSFSSELVAVKEIIRQRIEADVAVYNEREHFKGLVEPGAVEAALNAGLVKAKRAIDPVKQYAIAIEAFKTNGYFVLI